MASQTDAANLFHRVSRAVGMLNTLKPAPISFGPLRVKFLHWGVTPPAYWLARRHPNPCEIHKHSYFEICHALTGRGHFHAFNPEFEARVAKGDTFFARPGLVHQYGADLDDPLGICFWSFSIEHRGRAPGSRDSQAAAVLLDAANGGDLMVRENSRVSSVLSLIFDEALESAAPERLAPLLKYLALCIGTKRFATAPSDSAHAAGKPGGVNLWNVRQFVQDHCHRKLRVADLAAKWGYSTRHLARLFKTQLGEPFSEYLSRVRIQTASHLLLDDTFPLKQVARKSGFNSMPAFVRSFKRVTGTTPGEYRRRSLGANR